VDQVHGSVDHVGPVHHGPAAIAAHGSSPELGLRPLWCPRALTKGRERKREARGSRFRAHRGSEGGDGGALGVGSLRARREGKEGGGGAVGGADVEAPFYGVGGGAGWPGAGEERAARWCAIMAMKAAISEGDRPGSDEGGAPSVMGAEGGGAPGGGTAHEPVSAA
jgi:hypothetical protein